MDSLDAVVTKKPNKIIKVANSEAILKAIKEKKNYSYVWS
jgi:hypothetical protein